MGKIQDSEINILNSAKEIGQLVKSDFVILQYQLLQLIITINGLRDHPQAFVA